MEETVKNPSPSLMEEGSIYFVVLIPILHHNNLHFSVLFKHNNDYGT
jgi:hypothetical protein